MKLFNHYFIRCSGQRGVGLLEILIALAISAIMLMAITHMYGQFISASSQQKEQSLAQDQANFAFLTLNRAVRMSGAGLCVRPMVKPQTYFHQAVTFDSFPKALQQNPKLAKLTAESRLHGFTNPTKEMLGIEDNDNLILIPNSDALLVIYSDSNTRRINAVIDDSGQELSPQAASIYHDRRFVSPRLAKDDIIFYDDGDEPKPNIKDTWVMVSDCEHTGVYKYDSELIKKTSENILPNPDGEKEGQGFLYNFSGNGQASLASRLYAKLFFIAREKDSNIPHLYLRDLLAPDTRPQPLAAFVQKMKIEYLNIDNNNWVNSTSRDNSSNWDKNWPIRISLTMYAGNKYTEDADGNKIAPSEDEQVYTRILDIRN